MSFNLAQIRKDQYSSYVNFLDEYRRGNDNNIISIPNGLQVQQSTSDEKFYDTKIMLSSLQEGKQNLTTGNYYYLRANACFNSKTSAGVKNQNIDFHVILQTSDKNNAYQQMVGGYNISAADGKEYVSEFIMSPNMTYDIILFRLIRKIDQDYNSAYWNSINNVKEVNIQGGGKTRSRIFPLKNYSLYRIKNLLPTGRIAKRIRVEGNSGLLMCINGQAIRVPPSGVFEISRSNYPINFFGLAISNAGIFNNSSFIVNYQY